MAKHLNHSDLASTHYEGILRGWLNWHFNSYVVLFLVLSLVELGLVVPMQEAAGITTTTALVRYFLVPFGLNLTALAAALVIWRSTSIPLRGKTMTATLLGVFMAFVVYTVHSRFSAVFLVFLVPTIFSVVYGDARVTGISATGGFVLKTVSDLWIRWDPNQSGPFETMASQLDWLVSMVLLVMITSVCFRIIQVEQAKKQVIQSDTEERWRLYQESITDPLTGLQNRNGLRVAFDQLRAAPTMSAAWVVMLDFDNFKCINDTHGHTVGDRYLKQLSLVLSDLPNVAAFRYGGDEFCLLLTGCTQQGAGDICREVQSKFRTSLLCQEFQPLTISFGIAPYERSMPPSECIRRADSALYLAKEHRGSICIA